MSEQMNSYAELQSQIQQLQAQADEMRIAEVAGAKQKIREIMSEYSLTPADVFSPSEVRFSSKSGEKIKATGSKSPVAAIYKDKASESTWSGRGKPPRWIAGQDRTEFLINR